MNKNLIQKFSLSFYLAAAVAGLLAAPFAAKADSGLTLSVQPPLFQINLGRGEHWASAVTVENKNNYDQTLYASVLNFQPGQGNQQGALVPVIGEATVGSGYNLAQWVSVTKAPVTVRAGRSLSLPFSLDIPKDAAPGDHYAALIVGTAPANSNVGGTTVGVAGKVSSLLFVRVRGDIIERGSIREFRAGQNLYQTADAQLLLRAENSGNVRIQPQGRIDVYNMWGKLRGAIPINEQSGFGNILPAAVSRSAFSWTGEHNFFEIGRYKAVVTLTYGDPQKTLTSTAYFWVLPIISTALVLGGFLILLLFTVWAVRRFVRRSLLQETAKWQAVGFARGRTAVMPKRRASSVPVASPSIGTGLVLSARQLRADLKKWKSWKYFWSNNSHSLLVIAAIILIVAGAGIYLGQTLKISRTYRAVIYKDDGRNLQINNGRLEGGR